MASDDKTGLASFIRLTWLAVWRAGRTAPVLFLGAVLLWAAAGYGGAILSDTVAAIPSGGWWLSAAASLAGALAALAVLIVQSAALAPVGMAVHRLVVANDALTSGAAVTHRCVRAYALWLLAFLLLAGIGGLTGSLKGVSGTDLLGFFIDIAVLVVVLHCAFVLVMVADGTMPDTAKAALEKSWTLVRGQAWRLFAVAFGAALPVLVVAFAVYSVAGTLLFGTVAPAVLRPVGEVLGGVLAVALMALGAAAASWVYLWAADHRA